MGWKENPIKNFHQLSQTSILQMLGCASLSINQRKKGACAGPCPSAVACKACSEAVQGHNTAQLGWDEELLKKNGRHISPKKKMSLEQ